ncbi:MAG: thioredoxin family protein [Deltaproteobacteria bacterium]
MKKRTVEVFSAGCACCDDAVKMVKRIACPSCDVQVKDMKDPAVVAEAARYGIQRVPAVVIDGKLAGCCAAGKVDEKLLRSMGLGAA